MRREVCHVAHVHALCVCERVLARRQVAKYSCTHTGTRTWATSYSIVRQVAPKCALRARGKCRGSVSSNRALCLLHPHPTVKFSFTSIDAVDAIKPSHCLSSHRLGECHLVSTIVVDWNDALRRLSQNFSVEYWLILTSVANQNDASRRLSPHHQDECRLRVDVTRKNTTVQTNKLTCRQNFATISKVQKPVLRV